MANERVCRWATSQVGFLQHTSEDEAVAEFTESPEVTFDPNTSTKCQFKRTIVPRNVDHVESLLTRALHHPEDEITEFFHALPTRRRSLNSTISLASTADLTSDTGFTSPARTDTPSPPASVLLFELNGNLFDAKHSAFTPAHPRIQFASAQFIPGSTEPEPTVKSVQKKRISFACGPKFEAMKPLNQPQDAESTILPEEQPRRRSFIKFACPAKPASQAGSLHNRRQNADTTSEITAGHEAASPTTPRKSLSTSSESRGRQQRSLTPPPAVQNSLTVRASKYLTADASDLNTESSRFHEFASDEPLQDDWIRQNVPATCARLTINDTLQKENEIRRLGKEVEDEVLQEEEEEEEEEEDDEDEENDDFEGEEEDELAGLENDETDDQIDDEDEDEDEGAQEEYLDALSEFGSHGAASDGYNTDNETGFAESDDEDDGELQLWTHSSNNKLAPRLSTVIPVCPYTSLNDERSDSSSSEGAGPSKRIRGRRNRIKFRPGTPELPDSTDFVCGTLDEDRALENAYISCMAVRRREKLHLIPQDIDPSFPASEPEDEEIELHKRIQDSDEQLWIHGEPEDIHHTRDLDGENRKKKQGHSPPKRLHSPPPKIRGRSPKQLFDRHSPRRLFSPPPPCRALQSPPVSPHGGQYPTFRSGFRHTKSLPRNSALFPQHTKNHRRMSKVAEPGGHVRGAIDIVKGLEQKRQRRREKFKEKYLQKHNDMARKGQLPQQRPQPGKGAEYMRELGLLSAGKVNQGPYVLSV